MLKELTGRITKSTPSSIYESQQKIKLFDIKKINNIIWFSILK